MRRAKRRAKACAKACTKPKAETWEMSHVSFVKLETSLQVQAQCPGNPAPQGFKFSVDFRPGPWGADM